MTITSTLLWPLFAALFGAVFGSFFTVVVYRVPLGLSVVRPGSFCPHCKKSLRWFDNIPVLGWLLLRGKCRFCRAPIPVRYPLIELFCGLSLGLVAYIGMPPGVAVPLAQAEWTLQLMLLVWAAFPIVVTDFRSMLIPDVIVLPSIAMAIVISLIPGGLLPSEAVLGAVVPAVGLWLFARLISRLLGRDAMGFGDVKLVAFFGAVMGVKSALLAIIVGAILGLLVMTPLQRLGRHHRGAELPFGPFLYAGALISWFWGGLFWAWYLPGLGAV